MKNVAVILVLFVSCIAFINSSPLPGLDDNKVAPTKSKDTKETAVVSARQSANDDDDDDDDDEDDLDVDPLGVVDDDDDDDDEDDDEEDNKPPGGVKGEEDEDDDDDDDDDYLERFIDDILGGDEDDDDDDEDTRPVVEPIKPASPVQAPQAPVIPAAVQSDLNAADEAAVLAENSGDSLQQSSGVAEGAVTYDETAEEVPDVQPEGLSAINNNEGGDIQAQPPIVHQTLYPTSVAPVPANVDDDEDDDDDDDDDDIEALTAVDDEEEDDDDDDDDDDDEDDGELDDLGITSRRARAFEPGTPGDVSAIYVSKYNKFVDNILGRINKILKTNYDPVTVKLTNPTPSNKTNKTKKKKKTTKSKTRKSKETVKATSVDSNIIESTTSAEIEELLTTEATPLISTPSEQQTSSRGSFAKEKTKSSSSKNKKSKLRVKGTSNKNKLKQTKPKQKSRARATLYGLASLKRSGDVSVNMMSDHTTIRTKFNLGPLVLKVEKEFGRAAKKELRSATATTAEMSGKLSLRVMNGGAATLHSIRVLQPKQVRVDSPDDHDRTREFVWKRSSHIAHLVSQKLSSAARSMLRPPPTPEISLFK